MKNVVVTGANRGLGLEFVKQCAKNNSNVIACCRDPEAAEELIQLGQAYSHVIIKQLDVTEDKSIAAFSESLPDTPIDMLINNAGTSGEQGVTVGNIKKDNFLKVFETNCYGVVKTSEALLPLIEKSEEKLMVVISSRMASISDNDRGRSYAYRASKSAVNAVMRSFAIDVEGRGVKVLLLHPGWVQTDMGGKDGLVSAEESVAGMMLEIEKHGADAHAESIRRFDGGVIAW